MSAGGLGSRHAPAAGAGEHLSGDEKLLAQGTSVSGPVAGVRVVRMSVPKAGDRIHQTDAERHRCFLCGAAVTAAGFALRGSVCAEKSLGTSETDRNVEP